MKKSFSYVIIITIAGFVFFLSCKKEKSGEGRVNRPPIAIAGPDQVILYQPKVFC